MFLKELNICLGLRGREFDLTIPYNIQITRASKYGPSEVDIDFDHMVSPARGKPISKRLYLALIAQYKIEIDEKMMEENW